jgi:hypothetical protein
MIFPVNATLLIVETVAVDPENPEHEKYYSKGEAMFVDKKEIKGMALGYEMLDVLEKDTAGNDAKVTREFILFAEDVEGMVGLSLVNMQNIRIAAADFDKAIKRALRTA